MARLARTQRVRFTLLILCAAPRSSIFAQHEGHSASPIDSSATRFGSVSFANSGAASAQPAFLRGLALLHNFQYEGAASAFRDAQQRDPGFAMAYWGEAM